MRNLEELYHQSLEALPAILRGLGRQKRLSPEELEDLQSDIQVKLLEDDYRVLRQWDRRSSLTAYLGTVVYNIWHDRVRGEKGKLRVSEAARRLGHPARELEELLGRQGFTFEEAYQTIKPRFPDLSRREAEDLAGRIKPRPGRRFVSESVLAFQADLEPTGNESLEQREKLVEKRKAVTLLHRILSELPEQDRMLLELAHGEGVKFSRIARSLGIDQRSLYRRNEKLLTKLRTDLEEAGIRGQDLCNALGIDEPPGEYSVRSGIPRRIQRTLAETCVIPTEFAAFLEGSLTGKERVRMVRHLQLCPDCFTRYIAAAWLLDAIEEEAASAFSAAVGNRALPHRSRRHGWRLSAAIRAFAADLFRKKRS